jgi:hypothetical protein
MLRSLSMQRFLISCHRIPKRSSRIIRSCLFLAVWWLYTAWLYTAWLYTAKDFKWVWLQQASVHTSTAERANLISFTLTYFFPTCGCIGTLRFFLPIASRVYKLVSIHFTGLSDYCIIKGRVHLDFDLQFDLKFGACVSMPTQENSLWHALAFHEGTKSQVESQVELQGN